MKLFRLLALLLLPLTGALAQYVVLSGTLANRPTTCYVPQIYYATDQPVSSNTYQCTSQNTWTLIGGNINPSLDASNIVSGVFNIARLPVGTTSGTIAAGNDARFSLASNSLQITNNLSDLNNAATARTNLGLGSAATHASTDFQTSLGYTPLNPSNNLSDVSSTSTARTNLGLGSAATQNVPGSGLVKSTGLAFSVASAGTDYYNAPSQIIVGGAISGTANNTTLRDFLSVKDFGAKGDGTTDDTIAIQNAINAAASSSVKAVFIPSGNYVISSPINIPVGLSSGSIYGAGLSTLLNAKAGFTGASMLTSDATLSAFTLNDIAFTANGLTGITSVVNLTRTPESSIRNHIRHIQILGVATNNTGLVLDGCEDTTVEDSEIEANSGATNVISIKWHVPGGNLSVYGSTWFTPMKLSYQTAEISSSTSGPIIADGAANSLILNNAYLYEGNVSGGPTNGTFLSISPNAFNNIVMNGGVLTNSFESGASVANSVVFQGVFDGQIQLNGVSMFASSVTPYTLVGTGTVAGSSFHPSFMVQGLYAPDGATTGTPGTGVYVSTSTQPNTVGHIDAYIATNVSTSATYFYVPYPIKIIRATTGNNTVISGCTTSPSWGVAGVGTLITLTNGASVWDSGALSTNVNPGLYQISYTAGGGCTTAPAAMGLDITYQPQ